jgi:hypothetical protein
LFLPPCSLPKELKLNPSASPAINAALHPSSLRTFARGFALRTSQTAWLLGAGASADAGVPTADQLVDELLAVLYSGEQRIPRPDLEADPRWRDRVRSFYDGTHGLPPWTDDSFYSAIFERVYPDRDARARFVLNQLSGRVPHIGQYLLAGLVTAGLAPLLVTTNFDTLLEDAVRALLDPGSQLTVLDPESRSRTPFTMSIDARPLIIKIHGDLGAVTVKNTTEELAKQDAELRGATLSLLARYGLIVVGYSGRDASVMGMLREVLRRPTPFPAGLAWVRRPEDAAPNAITEFLSDARDAGVEPVHEVHASGMLELMSELEGAVTLPDRITTGLAKHRPQPLRIASPPPTGPVADYPQLRLAALPLLDGPCEARLLKAPRDVRLNELRESLRRDRVRAAVARRAGGQLIAFGDDAELHASLADLGVHVTDDTCPIGWAKPAQEPDSVDLGLIAESLARALGRTRGVTEVLRSGQHHLLRARDARTDRPEDTAALAPLKQVAGDVTGTLTGPGGSRLPWAEAVTLAVEWHDGGWWLLFAPDIWVRPNFSQIPEGVTPEQARAQATRIGAEFVRARVASRYNSATGALLGAWWRLLSAGGSGNRRTVHAFGVQEGRGVDAIFTFGIHPLVSRRIQGAALRSNS